MKEVVHKIFHKDEGHAWLEVQKSELVNLGSADKISAFSYERGTKAYLEEDIDAYQYIWAMESKGYKVNFQLAMLDTINKSIIRTYSPYIK